MRGLASIACGLLVGCVYDNGRFGGQASASATTSGDASSATTSGDSTSPTTAGDPSTSDTGGSTGAPSTTSDATHNTDTDTDTDATDTDTDTGVTPCWIEGACEPSAEWVLDYPAPKYGSPVTLARFSDGSIAAAGNYDEPILLGDAALPLAATEGVYLARISGSGDVLWVRSFPGPSETRNFAVAVDEEARVSITGHYFDQIDFGGGPRPGGNYSEFYLASFTGDGAWFHDRSVQATGLQFGLTVAADMSGGVVVGGYYNGLFDPGGGPLTELPFEQPYPYNHFVARYDDQRDLQWALDGGTETVNARISGVDVDGAGNVIAVGRFFGPLAFGPLVAKNEGKQSYAFAVKISPTGAPLWLQSYGDTAATGDQGLTQVKADVDDTFVVAGLCDGMVEPFGLPTLLCGSSPIVARVGADGEGIWARTLATTGVASVGALARTEGGRVVVAGSFTGALELLETTPASGFNDVFLGEFGADGALLWARTYGADNPLGAAEFPHSLVALGPGDVVLGAQLYDGVTFGGATASFPSEVHAVIARLRY
ncbi:MAG: hypothetical protein R3B09_12400 [Nannocystaceae bacterium]